MQIQCIYHDYLLLMGVGFSFEISAMSLFTIIRHMKGQKGERGSEIEKGRERERVRERVSELRCMRTHKK